MYLVIKHLLREISKLGRWVSPAKVKEHGFPKSALIEIADVG